MSNNKYFDNRPVVACFHFKYMYFVLISINGNHHKPTFILDDYCSNRAIQWNVQRTQHKIVYIQTCCGVQRAYVCEFRCMWRAIKACKNMFSIAHIAKSKPKALRARFSHLVSQMPRKREKSVDSNKRKNKIFQLQYYFDFIKYGNFRSQLAVTQSLQPD